jgi:hypothetical protein
MRKHYALSSHAMTEMLKILSDIYSKEKVVGYLHITDNRHERLINNEVSLDDIHDLQSALVSLYCKTDLPKYKKIREECKRDCEPTSCRYQRKAFTL